MILLWGKDWVALHIFSISQAIARLELKFGKILNGLTNNQSQTVDETEHEARKA